MQARTARVLEAGTLKIANAGNQQHYIHNITFQKPLQVCGTFAAKQWYVYKP